MKLVKLTLVAVMMAVSSLAFAEKLPCENQSQAGLFDNTAFQKQAVDRQATNNNNFTVVRQ